MTEERERCTWPAALEEDGGLLVVHMRAPLDPHDVQRVCAALRGVLERDPARGVACHVHGPPDVTVVGALARLTLLTRRLGVPLALRGCDIHLDELLALTGLDGAIGGGRGAVRPP